MRLGQLTIESSKYSVRKSPIGPPPPTGALFNPITGQLEMPKATTATAPSSLTQQASSGGGGGYIINIAPGTLAPTRVGQVPTAQTKTIDYQVSGGWSPEAQAAYAQAEQDVLKTMTEIQATAPVGPSVSTSPVSAAPAPSMDIYASPTSGREVGTEEAAVGEVASFPGVPVEEKAGFSPWLILGVGVLAYLLFRGRGK